MHEKGSVFEKPELYWVIGSLILQGVYIFFIWKFVAKEAGRFEEMFDQANPEGFDIKAA